MDIDYRPNPAELDALMAPDRHGKKHSTQRRRYIQQMIKKHGFYRETRTDPQNLRRPEKLQKIVEERDINIRTIPWDMADWLVLLMLDNLVCGARLQKGRGFCLKPPTDKRIHDQSHNAFWRCWRHGGRPSTEEVTEIRRSTQQKRILGLKRSLAAKQILKRRMSDNTNHAANLRAGLYADCLLPGEEELLETIDVESLDDEIRITKIRLHRLQVMQARVEDALLETDPDKKRAKLEILTIQSESTVKREIAGGTTIGQEITSTFKVPDYHNKINGLQAELGRMVKARFNQLILKGADLSPEERAQKARDHLNALLNVHQAETEDADESD